MKIGIIGAGWYGVHTACVLKKAGHDVKIYEKSNDIFNNISGKFGIRLHAGPHYPRSDKTRASCHRDYLRFQETYPELIVTHEYSIYALGKKDADGKASKVNIDTFRKICKEFNYIDEIQNIEICGYRDLETAIKIDEPSIVLGEQLRKYFRHRLTELKIDIVFQSNIELIKENNKYFILANKCKEEFDYIVNATSFQAFIPKEPLPFNIEVVYQPCIALNYEDTKPGNKPFSFIVMDGWYPCIMPRLEEEKINNKVILTHGKWTIMASVPTVSEAYTIITSLSDSLVEEKVKPNCEREVNRFWPEFDKRFKYYGWHGSVLAKIRTEKEFRSAVTFSSDNMIYIIPGKVSNIFESADEILSLINENNLLNKQGFKYTADGVLAEAMSEITEKISDTSRNTCGLQSLDELKNENKELTSKESISSTKTAYFEFFKFKGEISNLETEIEVIPESSFTKNSNISQTFTH